MEFFEGLERRPIAAAKCARFKNTVDREARNQIGALFQRNNADRSLVGTRFITASALVTYLTALAEADAISRIGCSWLQLTMFAFDADDESELGNLRALC